MIVLAWCVKSAEFVSAGARDLGQPDKWREAVIAKAAMYAWKPRKGDLEKAHEYAKREGYTVLVYEKEREPLVKARADMLALHAAGKVDVIE